MVVGRRSLGRGYQRLLIKIELSLITSSLRNPTCSEHGILMTEKEDNSLSHYNYRMSLEEYSSTSDSYKDEVIRGSQI
jgi:hypothetical protein